MIAVLIPHRRIPYDLPFDSFDPPDPRPPVTEVWIRTRRGRELAVTHETESPTTAVQHALRRYPGAEVLSVKKWVRNAANGVAYDDFRIDEDA